MVILVWFGYTDWATSWVESPNYQPWVLQNGSTRNALPKNYKLFRALCWGIYCASITARIQSLNEIWASTLGLLKWHLLRFALLLKAHRDSRYGSHEKNTVELDKYRIARAIPRRHKADFLAKTDSLCNWIFLNTPNRALNANIFLNKFYLSRCRLASSITVRRPFMEPWTPLWRGRKNSQSRLSERRWIFSRRIKNGIESYR